MRSGFQRLDDGRLYFQVVGTGEPVVLVHAFTLHSGLWDAQVAALAPEYRVVRYDMRGFGRSSLPARPYRHADDLKALLDGLGLRDVHLVGLSMGGGVAIDFALAYPHMLRTLVVADANVGGFRRWSETFTSSFDELYRIAREQGVEAAKSRWLVHPMFLPAQTKPGAKRKLERLIDDYSGWHFLHDDPQLPSAPAIDRLAEIEVPVLVMVGAEDLSEFQEMARRLEELPDLRRIVRIDGVGHMSNLEAPDLFNDELLGFLRG